MKKLVLTVPVLFSLLVFESCSGNRKVQRIDPAQQTDLSGRWNDSDSRLVANEMITDILSGAWRTNFEQKYGRKPVLIVGNIKNRTSEQIDPVTFIKDLERACINSGTISIVQSGEDRNQVREERNEQQTFSSEDTRKRWGKEKGADFMITGVISSIVDSYKNQRTIFYQVDLELTDLETNEKVWIGNKKIKKAVRN
ncbi:MAG: penicillin-binding protein activator LpoB [Bacteroidia bacterium]|jgi:hypothetical protein|nr:penicillin-binding protein activator LpoB [Bacteroidia bacterium]